MKIACIKSSMLRQGFHGLMLLLTSFLSWNSIRGLLGVADLVFVQQSAGRHVVINCFHEPALDLFCEWYLFPYRFVADNAHLVIQENACIDPMVSSVIEAMQDVVSS